MVTFLCLEGSLYFFVGKKMVTPTKYSEEWFRVVVGLGGEGLDPRKIKGEKVKSYAKQCVKIWGARSGHNGFILKNNVKDLDFNARVLKLWQDVYQRTSPPAGKIGFQFAVGAIAMFKAKKKVNWAAYASRARTYGHNSHKEVRDATPSPEAVEVGMEEGNVGSDVREKTLSDEGEEVSGEGEGEMSDEGEKGMRIEDKEESPDEGERGVRIEDKEESLDEGERGVTIEDKEESPDEGGQELKVGGEESIIGREKSNVSTLHEGELTWNETTRVDGLDTLHVGSGKQIVENLDPKLGEEANPVAHHLPQWLEDKERLATQLMKLEVEMGEVEHACLSIGTHLSMTKALLVELGKKQVVCQGRCEAADKQVNITKNVEGSDIKTFCEAEKNDAQAQMESLQKDKVATLLRISGMEVQLKQHNQTMSSCMASYNVALYEYFIVDCKVIDASTPPSTSKRKRYSSPTTEMHTGELSTTFIISM